MLQTSVQRWLIRFACHLLKFPANPMIIMLRLRIRFTQPITSLVELSFLHVILVNKVDSPVLLSLQYFNVPHGARPDLHSPSVFPIPPPPANTCASSPLGD